MMIVRFIILILMTRIDSSLVVQAIITKTGFQMYNAQNMTIFLKEIRAIKEVRDRECKTLLFLSIASF